MPESTNVQASMITLGNIYNGILKQKDPLQQEQMYKQMLPNIKQLDPRAPDQLDLLRGMTALSMGVPLLEEYKANQGREKEEREFERKVALQRMSDMKPTLNSEKLLAAKRRAAASGDRELYLAITEEEDGKKAEKKANVLSSKLSSESSMRNQYLSERRAMGDIDGNYRILQKALSSNSPAGQVTALYMMAKMNDPNSVKQGEIDINKEAYGYKKIMSAWNTSKSGQLLTPEQIADLKEISSVIYQSRRSSVDTLNNTFSGIATRGGLDPLNVVADPYYKEGEQMGSSLQERAFQAIEQGADPKEVLPELERLEKAQK